MYSNKIYRTKREKDLSYTDEWFLKPGEWDHDHDGLTKESELPWIHRYEHECDIIVPIIEEYEVKKVIELGSGPGKLSQMILDKIDELDYHLVDKIGAKNGFEHRDYRGTFHLKDLNLEFNVEGLPDDFDMLIANDFLEHIQAPSRVLLDTRTVLKKNGLAFISIPNWRSFHDFSYRGLFDFLGYSNSILKCAKTNKLHSEQTMPDDLIDSWNWYLLFKKLEK